MPIVTIQTIQGALTDELRSEIHRKVCDAMVETEGRGNKDFARYVSVVIEEQVPENFSIGGQMADEDFVKKITSV